MSVRIVRLGTERDPAEGTRIGTVRRVPRGVPKERYASENWFDVWFPVLSPTPELMAQAKAAESEKDWAGFTRAFKAEMAEVVMKPSTETVFAGDDAAKMQKLLDALENLDDVQEVYTTVIFDEAQ